MYTYNLTRCVSSHDGVVNDANRLSVKLGFDRRELSTDALLSSLLARQDECAEDETEVSS